MMSDRNAESDAPRADQSDVEDAGQCEWCGEEFDTHQWHYPGTEQTDDGDLRLRAFCSEHCRAYWEYRDSTATAED